MTNQFYIFARMLLNRFSTSLILFTALCSAQQELQIETEVNDEKGGVVKEELGSLIPQIFSEEERLEVLLQTYAKYNARLDFNGGF